MRSKNQHYVKQKSYFVYLPNFDQRCSFLSVFYDQTEASKKI